MLRKRGYSSLLDSKGEWRGAAAASGHWRGDWRSYATASQHERAQVLKALDDEVVQKMQAVIASAARQML